jgi:hypothetical protein
MTLTLDQMRLEIELENSVVVDQKLVVEEEKNKSACEDLVCDWKIYP